MTPGAVRAAWLYAAAVAVVVGLFLLEIPIQVSDSYGNMLKLDASWRELMLGEFTQRAFLRPLLWAELKVVYDLAGGSGYFAWFRGVHVAQVAVLIGLFVHLARPRTWADAAVLPLGLAALLGMHTFTGTVVEAFPINTFLTVVILCFAAAALALTERRWWHDPAAAVLFVVAALTVESGLLVGVILIGAVLLGARGISVPGAGVVGALLAGYFAVRLALLDVGVPGLVERASGYGFSVLEPADLVARFADRPWLFYTYNVLTSAASVLFAEPRAGVWRLTAGWLEGESSPALIVNVLACALTTAAVAAYAWRRRAAWRNRGFDHDDRLVLLFLLVLGANSVITYPYTKDVIMSPAGAFYALAAYVAVKDLRARGAGSWRAAAVTAACVVLAAIWAVRDVGAHANLRSAALRVRTDWVYAEGWARGQGVDLSDPRALELLRTLRHDAVVARPSPPEFPYASDLLDVE